MNHKKFTVITASYNAGLFIESSILSVINQNNSQLEYIVIDGGSTDNTLEILQRYSGQISYWISEPDKGIYDAWNKGIKQSTGDWILFIGCDDQLCPTALNDYSSFIDSLTEKDVEYISSRNQMINKDSKLIRVKGWEWEWPLFLKQMTVAHPGSLHSKDFFKKYGLYNIEYKIIGDYELLLRAGASLKSKFMNRITVIMSEGGASDSVAAIKEHYKAVVNSGMSNRASAFTNFIIISLKFRIKYFFRRIGFNVYLRK